MSDVTITCPGCSQDLEVPVEFLGQVISCPGCDQSIQLPSPEAEAEPEPVAVEVEAPAPVAEPSPAAPQTGGRRKKMMVTRRRKSSGGSAGGSSRACSYCGEQILRTAKKCKHCGEFVSGKRPVETNVKQGALIGAWACFLVGVVLMLVSLLLFLVYSPLFLAAFILSIVAMAQKRVAGGLSVLLLTLIIPPAMGLGLGYVRGKKAFEQVSESINEASAEIQAMSNESQVNIIHNNLRLIDAAKEMWALRNRSSAGTMVTSDDIASGIPGGFPVSPFGATYEIRPIGEPPRCLFNGEVYTP